MAAASLDVTKTYADNTVLTEAQLDTAFGSIENWSQNTVVNNLNQLKADLFPAGYDYDNDGNGNLTHTIYNKQSASVFCISPGGIALTPSNTATFVPISSSINLAFSPAATGKYLITYDFTLRSQVTSGGILASHLALYDITNTATLISSGYVNDPSTGVSYLSVIPTRLSYIYNFSSTAAATFSIYYNITNATNVPTFQFDTNATFKKGVYGQIHKI